MSERVTGWRPIETAPATGFVICGHRGKKWIRFGIRHHGRWYYSGTNERSQYGQVIGDEPTHWQPLPPPPSED